MCYFFSDVNAEFTIYRLLYRRVGNQAGFNISSFASLQDQRQMARRPKRWRTNRILEYALSWKSLIDWHEWENTKSPWAAFGQLNSVQMLRLSSKDLKAILHTNSIRMQNFPVGDWQEKKCATNWFLFQPNDWKIFVTHPKIISRTFLGAENLIGITDVPK